MLFYLLSILNGFSFLVDEDCFRALEFAKMVPPCKHWAECIWLSTAIDRVWWVRCQVFAMSLKTSRGRINWILWKIKIRVDRDEDGITGDEQWGRLEKVLLKSGWLMLKHVSLDFVIYNFGRKNDRLEMAICGKHCSLIWSEKRQWIFDFQSRVMINFIMYVSVLIY